MVRPRVLAAAAVLSGALAAAGVATAQSDSEAAACGSGKLTLPSGVVTRTGGIDIPVLVDVHTADLSELPGAALAASPGEPEAIDAVLPVYRARLITIATNAATNAGHDGVALADRQQREGLDVARPADGGAWRYEGTARLTAADVEQACTLAAMPEVDRVYSVEALLDATGSPTTTSTSGTANPGPSNPSAATATTG